MEESYRKIRLFFLFDFAKHKIFIVNLYGSKLWELGAAFYFISKITTLEFGTELVNDLKVTFDKIELNQGE